MSTDNYVFHLPMADSNQPDKEILLVSNNRILYLVKSSDIFSDSIKVTTLVLSAVCCACAIPTIRMYV